MKRLIAIPLMLLALWGNSQESNNLSVLQSPGSYDDGFSLAVQYEYQNKLLYVGPEVYYFPNLHDLDYIHLIGRFGFNILRLGDFKFSLGGRAGLIGRDWTFPYTLLGAECGVDYTPHEGQ